MRALQRAWLQHSRLRASCPSHMLGPPRREASQPPEGEDQVLEGEVLARQAQAGAGVAGDENSLYIFVVCESECMARASRVPCCLPAVLLTKLHLGLLDWVLCLCHGGMSDHHPPHLFGVIPAAVY